MKRSQSMLLLKDAHPLAEKIAEYLRLHGEAGQVAVAGSVRRCLEVVADIDIVVGSTASGDIVEFVQTLPGIGAVMKRDIAAISMLLTVGVKLNIHVVSPSDFFAALYYYTGNAAHNAQIADWASQKGFCWTERGLFSFTGEKIFLKDEQELCRRLELDYIAPELREGRGELSMARGKRMPLLITAADIRGGLHVHTNYSDGSTGIKDLRRAAQNFGWEYLGISDHSQSAFYAGGLKLAAILEQRREIDRLNADSKFTILAGIESDIKPDGSLDYSDDILAGFDFVIASVHSAFKQDEQTMTRRIVKAMSNRYVSILGHPSCRMLLKRPGIRVDLPAIIEAAAQTGTIIEINSSPKRLDLDWRWHERAKEAGVLLAVNPDAHSGDELSYIHYGLAAARKGGLTADHIINTRGLKTLKSLLRRKR